MPTLFGWKYNKDSVVRSLDYHAAKGNIQAWQHASDGKFAIALNDGFSGILTLRETCILAHGLASASKGRESAE